MVWLGMAPSGVQEGNFGNLECDLLIEADR